MKKQKYKLRIRRKINVKYCTLEQNKKRTKNHT